MKFLDLYKGLIKDFPYNIILHIPVYTAYICLYILLQNRLFLLRFNTNYDLRLTEIKKKKKTFKV